MVLSANTLILYYSIDYRSRGFIREAAHGSEHTLKPRHLLNLVASRNGYELAARPSLLLARSFIPINVYTAVHEYDLI